MASRYERQISLDEIGEVGQEKLSHASVLCIGAGGLGCPALLYLAAAGVGRIGIVDFDVVDESNLQRQVLYNHDDLGKNKAECAKIRLNALNSDIQIDAYPARLMSESVVTLFENYDLILDGTDNFETKYLINDAAVKYGKPFIYGSILRFEGQVSVFNYQDGPCYRCLFEDAPREAVPTCGEAGVIGAVAGIVGMVQAMEAIKLILDDPSFEILSGKLWSINTKSMESRIFHLPKDPRCSVCSIDKKEIILQSSSPNQEISAEDAQSVKDTIFLDVRELHEWDAGHIEGARHFPLSALLQGAVPDIAPGERLIVYCQAGVRSQQAIGIMAQKGFTDLTNLAGGYEAWRVEAA